MSDSLEDTYVEKFVIFFNYLHSDNVILLEELLQVFLIVGKDALRVFEIHSLIISHDLETGAGSAKVQAAIHFAVELSVIDVELQRLGKGFFQIRGELRQLFLHCGRVSVEHKPHQFSVLKHKDLK